MRQAIEHFQHASELDPVYAEAHASLAIAKTVGWGQYDLGGATFSASRAMELDQYLPMSWIAVALSAKRSFRLEEAQEAYREALAIDPRDAQAWHFLGNSLCLLGRKDEALQAGLQAVSLNASSAIYRVWLGSFHMVLNNIDEGDLIVLVQLGEIDEANRLIEAGFAVGRGYSLLTDLARFIPGNRMGETRYNEIRESFGLEGIDP